MGRLVASGAFSDPTDHCLKDILSYTERFRLARHLAANSQIFPSATSHKRTSLCCKPKIGPGLAGSNESCLPGVRRLVESRTPKKEGRHVVSSLSLLPIIMQTLKHTWTGHHLAVPTISLFGKQYINLLSPELYPSQLQLVGCCQV